MIQIKILHHIYYLKGIVVFESLHSAPRIIYNDISILCFSIFGMSLSVYLPLFIIPDRLNTGDRVIMCCSEDVVCIRVSFCIRNYIVLVILEKRWILIFTFYFSRCEISFTLDFLNLLRLQPLLVLLLILID